MNLRFRALYPFLDKETSEYLRNIELLIKQCQISGYFVG